MSKKPAKGSAKLRPDVAETAFRVMQEATGEAPKTLPLSERAEKNPDAVKRGRKGGSKGGAARAAKLGNERKLEIAREAARKRWADRSGND